MSYLRLLQLRRSANDAGGTAGGATGTETGANGAETGANGAETGANGAETGANGPETGTTETTDAQKAFTQADIDRVVAQTIAKERAKAEKAVQNARTEAEKLAAMTAEQRTEHQRQERENALNAREAELARRELRATALQTLSERGLPHELAETLNYTDAEQCNASIEGVEKAYRAAVQKGVESRLKGSAPKAPEGSTDAAYANLRAAFGLKPKS